MASQNWIKDVDNELFDAFKEETGIEVKVSLTPDNEYESLLGTTLSGGSDEFMALCDQILELGTMPLYEGINGTWHTQTWVYGMTDSMLQEKPDLVEFLNSSKDNKYADIACLKEGLTQLQQLLGAKEGDAPKYFPMTGRQRTGSEATRPCRTGKPL